MNIGVLLAAGTSTRFDGPLPKQLCGLNGGTVLSHSLGLLTRNLDDVIIVTNSGCLPAIRREHPGSSVVVNDVNCRIASIQAALDFLGKRNGNLLIHDAARPFVQDEHVRALFDAMDNCIHAQYVLKLVNGLVRKNAYGYEVVDRSEYLELVSPQVTEFGTFERIFRDHIQRPDRKVWEVLEMCSLLKLSYKLLEGHYRHFRKITTTEDLYS